MKVLRNIEINEIEISRRTESRIIYAIIVIGSFAAGFYTAAAWMAYEVTK
jgi:hypothetical protein